jgi:hypothetical protein
MGSSDRAFGFGFAGFLSFLQACRSGGRAAADRDPSPPSRHSLSWCRSRRSFSSRTVTPLGILMRPIGNARSLCGQIEGNNFHRVN